MSTARFTMPILAALFLSFLAVAIWQFLKARRESLRAHALIRNLPDVVTVIDPTGRVMYQSESVRWVFGHEPDQFVGRPLTALLRTASDGNVIDLMVQPGTPLVVELQMRDSAGQWRDTESTVTNLLSNPYVRGLVLTTRDVSDRKVITDELQHQAFHDVLTGLPNRALFRDRVGHALAARGRDNQPLALLFLDLDGFKEINDTLGHAAGDEVLQEVGRRVEACVRPGDTVARFGGDEFAVLLEQVDGDTGAHEAAGRISDSVCLPLTIDRREVAVQVSIGIAMAENGDEQAHLLMRNADLAMYQAKSSAKGGVVQFEASMYVTLVQQIEDEGLLRHALERGEFRLEFQPVMDLTSGEVVGAEALVRWQHPRRGLLRPNDFLPLAEESGMIGEIGSWVLNEACKQAMTWRTAGAQLWVSINLSTRQLGDPELVARVGEALTRTGLPATALIVEMSERQLVDRIDLGGLLRDLASMGVQIAVDDFGTGYASLSQLSRLPITLLKVDKSFVARSSENGEDAQLTTTIIRLAAALGLQTVAEGIETPEQLAALKEMGATFGQGFHFAQPCESEQIVRLATGMSAEAPRHQAAPRPARARSAP